MLDDSRLLNKSCEYSSRSQITRRSASDSATIPQKPHRYRTSFTIEQLDQLETGDYVIGEERIFQWTQAYCSVVDSLCSFIITQEIVC